MPKKSPPNLPPVRKGAIRMADIPAAVLNDLNAGRDETRTLVEWLAIDTRKLFEAAIADLRLRRQVKNFSGDVARIAGLGVGARSKQMGRLFHEMGVRLGRWEAIFKKLATHRSDMVRSWAAYMAGARGSFTLAQRLTVARRFAADSNMAVRECAWDSFRPFLAKDLKNGIRLLKSWARDKNENIRRCALEATRPRGVWTAHLEALKEDPSPGLEILEPVRADKSRYVQRAAGNWLNDASKSRPEWVRDLCRRWNRESRSSETRWITDHALRTLKKKKGTR